MPAPTGTRSLSRRRRRSTSKTIIEFHARQTLVRLHAVQFGKDSISGIPWLDHLTCDTCRVAYPLADVSGVRTGNPGAGAWVIAGPMLVVYAVLSVGSFIYYLGMRD